jgi:Tfp pilus assembly protein PilN
MKAVNLIPRDARRSGVGPSFGKLGASHFVIALLVVALGFVTLSVLASNTVSQRESQLAGLKQEYTRAQAQVARLNTYTEFEKLAQRREMTVHEIAASRFDWHSALADLSKVVPANTSLQSLVATASPTASGGGSGGSSGEVRGDISAPAFELKGCTGTQDEVAQLMSRLRVINGVTRVTLEDSAAAAAAPGSTGASSSGSGGCPAKGPTFDMVVFFQPGAGVLGSTSTAGSAK